MNDPVGIGMLRTSLEATRASCSHAEAERDRALALLNQARLDLAKLTRDAAAECGRLREQRDTLRNALEAVLHGDYVHYELSETPRKLALAALVAVAASDAREKGDRR